MAAFARDSPTRGLSTGEVRVGRHDFARSESARSLVEDTNNGRLSRQQSVRFTGQGCRQRRTVALRASESRLTPTPSNHRPPTASGVEKRARGAVSDSHDLNLSSSSFNPLRMMQRSDNCISSRGEMGSIPSVDRRIRKSKSMFNTSTPINVGNYFGNNPTQHVQQTSRYASLNKENTPLASGDASRLRAPKSTSFLRNRREDLSSQTSSHAENNLAVQLARDKFREQVEGQSQLKSHPSIFFRSRSRRADSSFSLRKSLRNSSNNSTALSSAFSGESFDVPKQGSLRKTARKVSSSIKTTLKGIFGQRASGTSASFAKAAYETQDTDEDSYLQAEMLASKEEPSMERGPSRIASIHAVPSPYRMKSLRGSFDSCEANNDAISDDKSRVTSWTDSMTNTITSHAETGDRERQRLSVIKENGFHVSNSGAFSSLASQDYAIGKAITVDSQRVYSALMRRAHEAKQREEEDRGRSVEEMRSLGRAPPRSSSVDQFEGQSWSPPTIRCVQPEDDVFQDGVNDVGTLESGSPRSVVRHTQQNQHSMSAVGASPNPWSEKVVDKQIPPAKARTSDPEPNRARTLTHRSSAFFASPANHLFRTTSPFRRALRENMKAQTEAEVAPEPAEAFHGWDAGYLSSMSAVSLPTRRPSPIKSETTPRDACAGSVYSGIEEDGKPDHSLVARFPVPPHQGPHGDATIFVSQTMKASPRSPIRDVSTASSVEWKTWLSSHVSRLEGTNTESSSTPWSSPDMFLGHVREKAEIESPSEAARSPFEIMGAASENTPLGPITGNLESRPSQKCSNFPLRAISGDENAEPSGDEQRATVVPAKQSCSPSKNNLRSTPSLPLINDHSPRSSLFRDNLSLKGSVSSNTLSQPSLLRKEEMAQRRRARVRVGGEAASSEKSSPGLTAAVEKQFGKTGSGSPAQHLWKACHFASSSSNPWIEHSARNNNETTSNNFPTMDSKRMVDSFLQSRRQMMGDHETNDGRSPAAFV